jgi:hypothetical protein
VARRQLTVDDRRMRRQLDQPLRHVVGRRRAHALAQLLDVGGLRVRADDDAEPAV